MYTIHQVIVQRASGQYMTFNTSDGEAANWLSQAATKFKRPHVWWARRGSDVSWQLLGRWGVKKDELMNGTGEGKESPFDPQGVVPLPVIGPKVSTGSSPAHRSRGTSGSVPSGETGPGLEPA